MGPSLLVQRRAVQRRAAQSSAEQCRAEQRSTAQHSTVKGYKKIAEDSGRIRLVDVLSTYTEHPDTSVSETR